MSYCLRPHHSISLSGTQRANIAFTTAQTLSSHRNSIILSNQGNEWNTALQPLGAVPHHDRPLFAPLPPRKPRPRPPLPRPRPPLPSPKDLRFSPRCPCFSARSAASFFQNSNSSSPFISASFSLWPLLISSKPSVQASKRPDECSGSCIFRTPFPFSSSLPCTGMHNISTAHMRPEECHQLPTNQADERKFKHQDGRDCITV